MIYNMNKNIFLMLNFYEILKKKTRCWSNCVNATKEIGFRLLSNLLHLCLQKTQSETYVPLVHAAKFIRTYNNHFLLRYRQNFKTYIRLNADNDKKQKSTFSRKLFSLIYQPYHWVKKMFLRSKKFKVSYKENLLTQKWTGGKKNIKRFIFF